MNDLDYCRQLAREYAYADYLCMLMLEPVLRRSVLPLIALNVELSLVAARVSEEMIAHIRYAWWRENLVAINASVIPRDHPVLRALESASELTDMSLERMVDEAQLTWPEVANTATALYEAVEALLAGNAIQLARWQQARAVVQKHGPRRCLLLTLKLLLLSVR